MMRGCPTEWGRHDAPSALPAAHPCPLCILDIAPPPPLLSEASSAMELRDSSHATILAASWSGPGVSRRRATTWRMLMCVPDPGSCDVGEGVWRGNGPGIERAMGVGEATGRVLRDPHGGPGAGVGIVGEARVGAIRRKWRPTWRASWRSGGWCGDRWSHI